MAAARVVIKVLAALLLFRTPLGPATPPTATANDVEEQRTFVLWLDFPAVSGCEDARTDPCGDAAADKETD